MQEGETYNAVALQLCTIYQDEYVKIEADDRAKYIFVKWTQHPKSEEFRKSFLKAAELTVENKYEYWLSDSRAIHYIEFADQNWILEHVAPLLPKVALKKFARLSTLESLSLMDSTRIYAMLEQLPFERNTQLEVFTTTEEALEWLFQVR
ncbi:hypothetical protein H8S95_01420 [Pontibacter sp. KCTC 32443]|uniref:hypothetical protein n=1 Tax=Pontibacter TaxID=323449 RepID=UPI00164DD125|nr:MULTISPECIES: hypothetical protein [Pontibacter]MBC5772708.1 hypothetical protein [Pontibacter sp. KCTC 32443]